MSNLVGIPLLLLLAHLPTSIHSLPSIRRLKRRRLAVHMKK
jgi:hypothetical protein